MWPNYVIAIIGIFLAIAACFVKNRIGKAVLSILSLLIFFGFSFWLATFVLPVYIGVHGVIAFVLCGAVFVVIMLRAWQPFTLKIRRIAAVAVLGAAVIVSTVFIITEIHRNAITITQGDEVNLNVYKPFGRYWYVDGVLTHHESQVAVFDGEATLKLDGNLPRLDGATALYPLYAAFVQASYPAPEPAPDIKEYIEYGNLWRDLIEKDKNYDWENNIPLIACSRTSYAFENLIDGYADVIFLMGVSDEQWESAAERGLELVLTPVGCEAFVFFVHSLNSTENISSDDIRRIYSGEVTNWKEIGGRNAGIRAYQRPESSGSQVMLKQIMDGVPIAPAPREDVYSAMMGMVKRVANYKNYKNSLGYSFLYYARDMVKEHNIKFLSIDGIAPTNANIASSVYPFANDFYAITVRRNGEYLNPKRAENIDKLLAWITSPQGQYLVEATGYVPVN